MSQIYKLMFLAAFLGCEASTMRQKSLTNKHLRIGAVVTPPFLVINKDINGNDVYSGLIWDFIEYIQEARNCSVTVIKPVDGLWGHCYGTNNCSGMIGQVNRKEVDIAVGMMQI